MKTTLNPLLSHSKNEIESPSDSHVPFRSRRLHPWTRLHSHYALMGGFAFDTTKVTAQFLPEERTQLTLTTLALRRLASCEPDLIPDLSTDQIREKSKADGFAKSIICLQALWFIAQVIGRLSLLELNTLIHAFCCLTTYLAWWHKPLDIENPSLIDASKDPAWKICAYMVMYSAVGNSPKCYAQRPIFQIWLDQERHLRKLAYEKDIPTFDPPHKSSDQINSGHNHPERLNHENSLPENIVFDPNTPVTASELGQNEPLKLYPFQTVFGFRLINIVPEK